jgi:hypothetical protein
LSVTWFLVILSRYFRLVSNCGLGTYLALAAALLA